MADDKMIDKIQALLNKAENTTFEAERDTFLAKAQELMTKHAIERWQLGKAKGVDEKPVQVYFIYSNNDANLPGKKQLLAAAAKAAGCEVVLVGARGQKRDFKACFIGYAADAEFAQMLYTSLALQAQRFAPADVRKVKARFTDFMLGFASVVAARLAEQEREDAKVDDYLPAMIDRSEDVRKARDEFFPRLGHSKAVARRQDWAARSAGAKAGQRADISGGRRVLPS